MTQEQVIQLGEKALEVPDNIMTTIGVALLAGGFLGFAIALGLETSTKRISRTTLASCSIFMILGGFILGGFVEDSNAKMQIEQTQHWKKNVAIPYIRSLPVEKKTLFNVEIDNLFLSKGDNQITRPSKLTPLILSYKEGEKVLTVKGLYEVRTSLEGKEKPYVTYQVISKDLGMDLKKGWHNVIVYLPKKAVLNSKN